MELSTFMRTVQLAREAAEVTALLTEADAMPQRDRKRALLSVLRALLAMKYPHFGELAIEQALSRPEGEADVARDGLRDWLRRAGGRYEQKREQILVRVRQELGERAQWNRVSAAIWLLLAVGYRDEVSCAALIQLAGIEGGVDTPAETQDEALWALAWLGWSPKDRLVARVKELLGISTTDRRLLLQTTWHLRSPSLLPELVGVYHRMVEHERSVDAILRGIAEIAEANPDHTSDAWQQIEAFGDDVFPIVRFAGDIAQKIDDARVPLYFFRRLEGTDSRLRADETGPNWRIYLRLRDLSLPSQLEGFTATRAEERGIAMLRQDAVLDTRNSEPYQTGLTLLKKAAWDVALRVGAKDALDWILPAMQDTSQYMGDELAEIAGFLRVRSAVPVLARWLMSHEQHFRLRGAIRGLGAIGTVEALTALLGASFDRGEGVPLDYAYALADASIRVGDVEPLVQAIERGTIEDLRWIGCSAALVQVASQALPLLRPHRDRVFRLLEREDLATSRGFEHLVSLAGFLSPGPREQEHLKRWAAGGSDQMHGLEALEALARSGTLASERELLQQLGLKSTGAQWDIERPLSHGQAFVLGLLYDDAPDQFSPAVASSVVVGDYSETAGLLSLLSSTDVTHPEAVIAALVDRARRRNGRTFAESDALDTLATLDPARLVREFPHEVTTEWSRHAKEWLVVAFGRIGQANGVAELRDRTLSAYLLDASPTVARAAARSLSVVNPERLGTEVARLGEVERRAERIAGVKAAAWLTDEAAFLRFWREAAEDAEGEVRAAAKEAWDERRAVRHRSRYLQTVLDAREDDLLAAWRYGQSLSDLADDSTVSALWDAAGDTRYPINKRSWLAWLARGGKKSWEDRERRISGE